MVADKYIVSDANQGDCMKWYEIKVTSEFGRGLYSKGIVMHGQVIEYAELLVLSPEDTLKVNETDLKYYTFVFDAAKGQDCLVMGNGEIFNHSDVPNVHYKLVRHEGRTKMVFQALRHIEPGEQLFIDYNQDTQVQTASYIDKNLVG